MNNSKKLTFAGISIGINIVLGTIVGWMSIPLLFLDTVGTVLSAVVLGPVYGMAIGGITGDFNDVFFTALKNAGTDIFSAAFIPRITSNIIDKVISCVLVAISYRRLEGVINGH